MQEDGEEGDSMNLGFLKEETLYNFRKACSIRYFVCCYRISCCGRFIAVSIISGINKGQAGIIIGVVGLLLFALSITGFVFSYRAIKRIYIIDFP